MKQKNKILLISFLGTIAVAVIMFYFVLSTTLDLQEKNRLLKQEIADLKVKKTELIALTNNLDVTLEDYQKIKSFFVSSEGTVDFIEQIESVARESRISVLVSNVATSQREDLALADKETLTLSIEAGGSFKDLTQFFLLIENLPVKVSVLSETLHFVLDKEKNQNTSTGDLGSLTGAWRGSVKIETIKQK